MLALDRVIAQLEQADSGMPLFEDLQGRKRSRPDFAGRVRRLAAGVRELGFSKGDRFSILSLNSLEFLELFFAVPVAGGVVSPLNARWSPAELIYGLNDSGAKALAVDETFAKVVPAIRPKLNSVEHFVFLGQGEAPEGMISFEQLERGPLALTLDRDPDDLAIMGYTGGTTGFPKGVVHTHKSACSTGLAMVMGDFGSARNKLVSGLPLFHMGGWGITIARLMQSRSTNVVAPMFRPDLFRTAVLELGATSLGMVPAMMQMLIEDPNFRSADYASVDEVIYGASPISVQLLQDVRRALPSVKLRQGYGMSEAGMGVFMEQHFHEGPLARPTAAGQACSPLMRFRIEGEEGEELPRGEIGEVVFYGETLMRGYHNKPEETAKTFRNGGLLSGDLGYMDEMGVLFLKDRSKDMIVSGGENVYSAEVENALASHPAVSQVAVIGVPDKEWGEAVHAVVVPAGVERPTVEELRDHARQHIAGYKCPRGVTFVEELPRSAMNKVLKHQLRDMVTKT